MLRHFRSTSSLRTTTKRSLFYVLMVAIWNWISAVCPLVYQKRRTCTLCPFASAHSIRQCVLCAAQRHIRPFRIQFRNIFAIIGRIYVSMLNEKMSNNNMQWQRQLNKNYKERTKRMEKENSQRNANTFMNEKLLNESSHRNGRLCISFLFFFSSSLF